MCSTVACMQLGLRWSERSTNRASSMGCLPHTNRSVTPPRTIMSFDGALYPSRLNQVMSILNRLVFSSGNVTVIWPVAPA